MNGLRSAEETMWRHHAQGTGNGSQGFAVPAVMRKERRFWIDYHFVRHYNQVMSYLIFIVPRMKRMKLGSAAEQHDGVKTAEPTILQSTPIFA
jgi:hypothetical protein